MKYIIDIPEEAMMYLNVWEYKDGKCVWADSYLASDLKPYTASESYIDGLRKGQKEVWDFVRIITDMTECERKECFGGSTCDLDEYMTYQEAKTKYDAWKKQKEEIHVGDEVEQITASGNPVGLKCVVTKILGDEILKGVLQTGECVTCSSQIKRWWRKTGRHFDEVDELLKKMRED